MLMNIPYFYELVIDVIAGTQELVVIKAAIWQGIQKAVIHGIETRAIDIMQIS